MVKGQLLGLPNWLKKKIEKNEHAIDEINSKFVAITDTTPNHLQFKTIPYPNGFNMENCFIINSLVNISNGWAQNAGMNVDLMPDGVQVYNSINENWGNKGFKVLLYKYQ